jgi:hypothetical protein
LLRHQGQLASATNGALAQRIQHIAQFTAQCWLSARRWPVGPVVFGISCPALHQRMIRRFTAERECLPTGAGTGAAA